MPLTLFLNTNKYHNIITWIRIKIKYPLSFSVPIKIHNFINKWSPLETSGRSFPHRHALVEVQPCHPWCTSAPSPASTAIPLEYHRASLQSATNQSSQLPCTPAFQYLSWSALQTPVPMPEVLPLHPGPYCCSSP